MTHEEQLVAIARDLTAQEVSLAAALAEEQRLSAALDQVKARVRELNQDMLRNRDRLMALAKSMPPESDVVVAAATAEPSTLTAPAEARLGPLPPANARKPEGRRK